MEHASSPLISETKQGQVWLVRGWKVSTRCGHQSEARLRKVHSTNGVPAKTQPRAGKPGGMHNAIETQCELCKVQWGRFIYERSGCFRDFLMTGVTECNGKRVSSLKT